MSSITALTTIAASSVNDASTKFYVRATAGLGEAAPQILAGGIISTATDQLNQFKTLVVVIGGVIGLIAFFIIAARKSWAIGGIIQGLFVGALIAFAVGGGGTIWLGNQFKDQLGS
ncbi:hypothetical protein VH571_16155 [Frondihabitans sp. 4ASC-45]|jgi:hypothetical protein|uniref:hypothetical protein n=1 Tax=Frondihabitans sp. 4ASC-45 TaxID=3111636 RepID=UPI003C1CE80F